MADGTSASAVPQPVTGLYDVPFWESARARRLALQRCSACGAFRYPPGPVCPECLSDAAAWTPLSGGATILSWAVFHRQYLPAYPPPYNVIAVRLDEGPVMISNLEGAPPEGDWIGRRVRLTYADVPGGLTLPRFAPVQASGDPAAESTRRPRATAGRLDESNGAAPSGPATRLARTKRGVAGPTAGRRTADSRG